MFFLPFRLADEIYRWIFCLLELDHRIAGELSEIDLFGLGVLVVTNGACVDCFDTFDVETQQLLVLEAEDEWLADGDGEPGKLQQEFFGHQVGVVGLQRHTEKYEMVKN